MTSQVFSRISKKAAATTLIAGTIIGSATVVSASSPFGSTPVTQKSQQGQVCIQNKHGYPMGGSQQGDLYACSGIRFSPDGKTAFVVGRAEDDAYNSSDPGFGAYVAGYTARITSVQFIVNGKPYDYPVTNSAAPTGVAIFETGLTFPSNTKTVAAQVNYDVTSPNYNPANPPIPVTKGSVTSSAVHVPKSH